MSNPKGIQIKGLRWAPPGDKCQPWPPVDRM